MIPVSKTGTTFDMPQPPRNTMIKKPLEIFSTFPITEEESIYHHRGMSGNFLLNFNERYHRHENNVKSSLGIPVLIYQVQLSFYGKGGYIHNP